MHSNWQLKGIARRSLSCRSKKLPGNLLKCKAPGLNPRQSVQYVCLQAYELAGGHRVHVQKPWTLGGQVHAGRAHHTQLEVEFQLLSWEIQPS